MPIDLHCHILPAIDDGAKSVDQALAMARLAEADGTTDMVCTPHHLNGLYVNTAAEIRRHTQALQQALNAAGLVLRLHAGAEHHLVPELPQALREGSAITLADGGRFVLVELPVHDIPLGAETLLAQIMALGLTPIIAHPERNAGLRAEPQRLLSWVEMGCLGQITAQSCTGEFGEPVQQASRHMLASGGIQLIASDAHRDRRRVPVLSEGWAQVESWIGAAAAQLINEVFPAAVLAGEQPDLDALVAALPASRGRWFSRWRRG